MLRFSKTKLLAVLGCSQRREGGAEARGFPTSARRRGGQGEKAVVPVKLPQTALINTLILQVMLGTYIDRINYKNLLLQNAVSKVLCMIII